MRHLWTVLCFILAALLLNGCGNVNEVSVPNDAPVANAGPDLGSLISGTRITLNGSASTDPNGNPLTYSWTLLTKPAGSASVLANPTSVTPTVTLDGVGDYVVQLIVNDGAVNSAPDTVIITSDNVAPVANAGSDQGSIAPGSLVTLDGSASTDGDGDPLTYRWSLISKPTGSAAVLADPTSLSPTFTVDRAGNYVVQLIVNDGTVNSTVPDTVVIATSNVAPVANAGPDQGVKALGSLVILNGSASSDANGDPLTYRWSLISKPTGSAAVLADPASLSRPLLSTAHNYVVQLIVNDSTVKRHPIP